MIPVFSRAGRAPRSPLHLTTEVRSTAYRITRLTLTAVASYVLALALLPKGIPPPLLAPLTALLVVQHSVYQTIRMSIHRVASVTSGVLLAVLFASTIGFTWWTLGLTILAALTTGYALHLGDQVLEVPISAMLIFALGASSGWAAADRVLETLIGAGTGLVATFLVPSVRVRPAAEAVTDLSGRLSALVGGMSSDLTRAPARGEAARWLDEANRLNRDLSRTDRELGDAEDSVRLNPRARDLIDAGVALRNGVETMEHFTLSLRGLTRSLADDERFAEEVPEAEREEEEPSEGREPSEEREPSGGEEPEDAPRQDRGAVPRQERRGAAQEDGDGSPREGAEDSPREDEDEDGDRDGDAWQRRVAELLDSARHGTVHTNGKRVQIGGDGERAANARGDGPSSEDARRGGTGADGLSGAGADGPGGAGSDGLGGATASWTGRNPDESSAAEGSWGGAGDADRPAPEAAARRLLTDEGVRHQLAETLEEIASCMTAYGRLIRSDLKRGSARPIDAERELEQHVGAARERRDLLVGVLRQRAAEGDRWPLYGEILMDLDRLIDHLRVEHRARAREEWQQQRGAAARHLPERPARVVRQAGYQLRRAAAAAERSARATDVKTIPYKFR